MWISPTSVFIASDASFQKFFTNDDELDRKKLWTLTGKTDVYLTMPLVRLAMSSFV
jgi:hypothetical protein